MPKLVDQAKIEKAAEAFNEKVVKHVDGDQEHMDLHDHFWHVIAYAFFSGMGLDIFEIDRATDICRERNYMWKTWPDPERNED
jgi:hypothetical protein